MSYYAGMTLNPATQGWQQEDTQKIDDNYLAYLARKLNDVSRSTKNNGQALLQEYMANLDTSNGTTQTPVDWENLKKLSSWYAGTKHGKGTTFESFQQQFGKNFGSWQDAGSKESQGYVTPYGTADSSGLVQTGQTQDTGGQSQYPAMANEYGLGSQQNDQQLNSQATTAPAAGTTQSTMSQQSGGQAAPTQQPLTQQAGSESSRGFNPWSLIGESIARSR